MKEVNNKEATSEEVKNEEAKTLEVVHLKVGQLLGFDAFTTWRHDLVDRTRDGTGILKFSKYRMQAVYNGLACPRCGGEMYDPYAQVWIPGHYPQNLTKCAVCKYCTHRPV